MINVMTWLWEQPGRVYTAAHVNLWAQMIRRNLTIPHIISCVTDLPAGIDKSINIIPLPATFDHIKTKAWDESKGVPQCYRRIDIFRPDAAKIYGQRFVSMDVDTLIIRNMDSFFDRPEDIVLLESSSPDKPYNGGITMMTAGCRPEVFEDFSQDGAETASTKFCGSDQAWISYRLGWGEALFTLADGHVFYRFMPKFIDRAYLNIVPNGREYETVPDWRVMSFPGHDKPWLFNTKMPKEITDHYVSVKDSESV